MTHSGHGDQERRTSIVTCDRGPNGICFGMTKRQNRTRLLNTLYLFKEPTWTATWRSGYAAVCKSDRFALLANVHSEKLGKFRSFSIKGLAFVSERHGSIPPSRRAESIPVPVGLLKTRRMGGADTSACSARKSYPSLTQKM